MKEPAFNLAESLNSFSIMFSVLSFSLSLSFSHSLTFPPTHPSHLACTLPRSSPRSFPVFCPFSSLRLPFASLPIPAPGSHRSARELIVFLTFIVKMFMVCGLPPFARLRSRARLCSRGFRPALCRVVPRLISGIALLIAIDAIGFVHNV